MELDFASFRRILCCNQEQFAEFLDVKKSVLSMAELKQRALPADAWIQFIQLRDCASKINENIEIELPSLMQNETDSLVWSNQRVAELQVELSSLNSLIAEVEREFNEAMFALNFLQQFEQEQSDKLTELQLNLIAIWKGKNLLRLVKNGPDTQKKLGAQRASLIGELSFLNCTVI